jgi:hypothetical protein
MTDKSIDWIRGLGSFYTSNRLRSVFGVWCHHCVSQGAIMGKRWHSFTRKSELSTGQDSWLIPVVTRRRTHINKHTHKRRNNQTHTYTHTHTHRYKNTHTHTNIPTHTHHTTRFQMTWVFFVWKSSEMRCEDIYISLLVCVWFNFRKSIQSKCYAV